ncbi:MAG: dihydrolipoamide acetyltransferase family protein [Actinomycetota bacterium]|nr:2-oxo acid dehydrogenase subunit E2 [Actinomycetota bacterium]
MADEVREFKLPDLGEGLTEAEIVSWMVKEGEEVSLNQPIVEVETEKAIVEIPSPFAGTVEKLHGDVGERVNVGAALVSIRTDAGAPQTGRREVLVGYGPDESAGKRKRRKIGKRGEEASDNGAAEEEVAKEEEAVTAKQEAEPRRLQSVPSDGEPARTHALATPPVRKLAREMGVDLDSIDGTGPDGRVTREDVEGAASAPKKAAAAEAKKEQPAAAAAAEKEEIPAAIERRVAGVEEEERIPVRSIRRSIAEHMVRSYTEIPHVTEWCTVDATEIMAMRKELSAAPEANGKKISPLPICVRALVAAIRKYPRVNSAWDKESGDILVKKHIHVGIATDTDRGLLVPVVRHADQLNVFEVSQEIARLVATARDASIGAHDLRGSTVTITNVGSFGMESGTPIINSPEAAILALGAITKRPWVLDGQIVPRDIMTIALTFDHRILDGAEAGRFLRYMGDLIEHPARLLGVL